MKSQNSDDVSRVSGSTNAQNDGPGAGSSISLHLSAVDIAFLRRQSNCSPLSFLISLGLAKLLVIQVFGRIRAWRRNPQARLVLLLTVIDQLCLKYSESKTALLKGSDPSAVDCCEPVDLIEVSKLRGSIDCGLSSGLATAVKGGQNGHK